MLSEKTNDIQAKAFEYDDQTKNDRYQEMQMQFLVLRKHYETLYGHYQVLIKRCPTVHDQSTDRQAFRQTLHDYYQSHQEHRHLIQHFRHTLNTYHNSIRSYRSEQNSRMQTGRLLPFVRKTILLGVGSVEDAALLKESMGQAGTHRVFVAADSNEVMSLLKNVHIDLLVLSDALTPHPGVEMYKRVQRIKGLEDLPTIILNDCFSPFHFAEQAYYHLIELDKPIQVDAVVKAIDQLLV